MEKICPRCGKTFECLHSSKCWCVNIHISDKVKAKLKESYSDCLCKECLEELNNQ